MEKETLQNDLELSNSDNYLLQKKFEIMIDTNNKKMINELNRINNMINKLNEEICEIKKHLDKDRTTKTEPVTISDKDNNQNLNPVKNQEQKIKPRYGDYQPEDVAIEKFFYFGKKSKGW